MIGTTIEARSPQSLLMFILLALVALFLGLGLALENAGLLLLVIPLLLPVPFLYWLRPKAQHIRIDEQGLQLEHPFLEIPWQHIHGVRRRNQKQNPNKKCSSRYDLEVHHDEGILLIPSTAQPPVEKLYLGFMEMLSPTGSRDVPEMLQDHQRQWTTTFGEDKVFSFRSRPRLGNGVDGALVAVAICFIVGTLLAWVLAATVPALSKVKDLNVTLGTSTFFLMVFAIIFLFSGLSRQNAGPHRKIKKWKDAGVVISPAGLAMTQGVLQGEMKWAEVLDVQFQKKLRDGILIKVAGAQFQIFDNYDRPIFFIYRQIMKYWSNESV